MNYCRHLTAGEIKLFVLSRIINRNPFEKGCPLSFIPIYNQFPDERKHEVLDDCKLALSKTFFNKNSADNFWKLFSNVYFTITNNVNCCVEEIYALLDVNVLLWCQDFDVLSLKYFIATVKDGIKI